MGASCPAGEAYDPREGCACRDAEELKSELYPAWATEDDIRRAVRAAWEDAGAQNFQGNDDNNQMMANMLSSVESLLEMTALLGAFSLSINTIALVSFVLYAFI